MSIFPKRVCKGENIIIHFKTKNDSNLKYINYEIMIIDDCGNKVDLIKNNLISSGEREVYYFHKAKQDEIPGKYHVRTKMYLNGRVVESFSSIADFYFLDEIKVENINNTNGQIQFVLINKSKEETPFSLIKIDGTEILNGKLNGNQRKQFSVNEKAVFLKYGNNNIEKIGLLDNIYNKSNNIRWRIYNGKIEALYKDTLTTYVFDSIETKIWVYLDGINNIYEIAEYSKIDKEKIKKAILKMEEKQLVIAVRKSD